MTDIPYWHLLHIDDDEDDYILTRMLLQDAKGDKFELEWASSFNSGLKKLLYQDWDAALIDYDLGGEDGLNLIRQAVKKGCKVPMIVVTGRGSYEKDIEAMEAGAADYISKSQINAPFLERAIRYAIGRRHIEEELVRRVNERTEELRRHHEQNELLGELSHRLSQAFPDLDAMYNEIMRLAGQRIGEFCVVGQVSPDGRIEMVRCYHPNLETYETFCHMLQTIPIYMGEGASGISVKEDRAILLDRLTDPTQMEKIKPEFHGFMKQFGIHSILSVPIHGEQKVLGVLWMARADEHHPFAPEDMPFVQGFADRIGLVTENTRLYNVVQAELVERQRVQEELATSQIMFESLFENAPDAILLINGEMHIIKANQQAQDLFGYDQKELDGLPLNHLIPWRFRPSHENHVSRYLQNPERRPLHSNLDLLALTKDGREIKVQIALNTIYVGKKTYVISILREIEGRA